MSVDALHTIYAVDVNVTGTSSDIFIDQVQDQSLDPGIQMVLAGGDGSVYNTYTAVGNQSPSASFNTTAIAAALAKIGAAGLAIDAPGVTFSAQKLTQGGTRATGSNHVTFVITEGVMVPTSITASHNEPATIGYTVTATYDGTNLPFVIAGSAALPTGTPSVSELFTVGKVMINGTELTGIQSINVDFGIRVIVEGANGEVYPTFTAIGEIQPSITMTTTDAVSMSTFGLSGAAQGATDSIVYLRKYDEGGTRKTDVTAEHISFTIDEGHIGVTSLSGGHNDKLMSSVTITPTYDGTNNPLVLNTAVAIA